MGRVLHSVKVASQSAIRTAKARQHAPAAAPRHRRLLFEALEVKALLSASLGLPAAAQVTPLVPKGGAAVSGPSQFSRPSPSYGSTTPAGLSPNQIRGAYGLGSYTSDVLSNGISFGGIQGDGRGQTIALVDAYDYPTALSDLNAFSSYYGLPIFNGTGDPTFEKLNQTGGTSLPGTDPAGPSDNDWEGEEALDIEWAHAIAPMANIILFEASDDSNNLFVAARTAANTPGVVVVSMSWSNDESSYTASQLATYDSTTFSTPSGHVGGSATLGGGGLPGGVTFLAAAGDSGPYEGDGTTTISPQYPASSPNVIAVGGTSLTVDGSSPNYTYGGETAWGDGVRTAKDGGGGGGISALESQPSYQNGVASAFSTTQRTYPDVSADANPSSGVPVYDSYDDGASTPWNNDNGGTSVATPIWGGIIAIADEGRAIAGLGSLNGRTQTLPALYSLPAADFHDITSGSTGSSPTYAAGTGYDLATGIGSPVANLLIPGLVGDPAVPSFALSSPASGSYVAGQTITIQWTAADVPSGSTISLAFDTTSTWGNPKWIEIDGVTAADGNGSYTWNTTGLTPGTYYLDGYMYTSSSGAAVLSHLTTSFTVTAAAGAATFTLSSLAAGSYQAGATISIQWIASNVPSGSTISLAYDTTSTWGNPKWIEIDGVTAANGSGSYNWNTTGLAAGTYYLDGYMYTPSTGTAVLSHLTTSFTVLPFTAPATFALSSPAFGSYLSGQLLTIQWTATNVPAGSTISLAYDTTSTWGNPKWIEIDGVTAANGSGAYNWNTTGLPAGTYYLDGYLYTPSTSSAVTSNLATSFTVTSAAAAPTFTLSSLASGSYVAGETVSIQWVATNVPSGSLISLAYDTTSTWGNPKWIEIDGLAAASGSRSYNWNTTGLSAGTYYLDGYMYTPSTGTAVLSHLTTPFTVITPAAAPTFTLSGPASGSYLSGQLITIQWTATNVPAGSLISLAYDTTSDWGNPKWIEIDGASAANGSGSYNWTTTGLAPGTYYLDGYLYTPSTSSAVLSNLTTSFTVSG